MPSIAQAKADIQKLIQQYNKLQNEAKSSTAAEAARKASEAEKLAAQISSLQVSIARMQAKEREKQGTATVASKTSGSVDEVTAEYLKRIEDEQAALESRIAQIQVEQRKNNQQIEQLAQAERELSRVKEQIEQHAKDRHTKEEKMQREISQLTEKSESEKMQLRQELESIRRLAEEESNSLKAQRDAARAMLEKQKQEEQEKLLAAYIRRRDQWKWTVAWIAAGIGIGVVLFALLIFVTPVLDGPISHARGFHTGTTQPCR